VHRADRACLHACAASRPGWPRAARASQRARRSRPRDPLRAASARAWPLPCAMVRRGTRRAPGEGRIQLRGEVMESIGLEGLRFFADLLVDASLALLVGCV